jgi:hypothetical protein
MGAFPIPARQRRSVIATTRAGSLYLVGGYRPRGDGGVWYPRPTSWQGRAW